MGAEVSSRLKKTMKKIPKRKPWGGLVGGIKIFLGAELAFFAVSLYYWRKMNSSQDFRYTVHQKYPFLLNGYYEMGERFGSLNTRKEDYQTWGLPLEK
ncbi:protein CEBPZOS-like isoform X1 [Haliotis asinina]|uniref:protein CEBPZOS-like isoform X1 n=1 Tax=Haliotis asinina TaxID=109174 RepID=UPI003532517D